MHSPTDVVKRTTPFSQWRLPSAFRLRGCDSISHAQTEHCGLKKRTSKDMVWKRSSWLVVKLACGCDQTLGKTRRLYKMAAVQLAGSATRKTVCGLHPFHECRGYESSNSRSKCTTYRMLFWQQFSTKYHSHEYLT